MDFTPIARYLFAPRIKASLQWIQNAEAVQRAQLSWLVNSARNTLWGEQHNYGNITSYEEFASKVPITPYENIRSLVERMIDGERDILLK